jgi:hypothetical protein
VRPEVGVEVPPEARREGPPEVGREGPAEVGRETPAEVGRETPVEVRRETPVEVGRETPAEVGREAPAEVGREAPAEVGPDVPPDVLSCAPNLACTPASGCAIGVTSCATGTSVCDCSPVLLFDDFSAAPPWTDKVARPWPGNTGMDASTTDGRMTIANANPSIFEASYVKWNPAFDFRDTGLQADMTAASNNRSYEFVMWGDTSTYIIAGLQRDVGAYLFVDANGSTLVEMSAAVPMPLGQSQRVTLEIRSTGQVQVLVDGAVVIDTTTSFALFPANMSPGIGSNSHGLQTFTFDNLLAWRLQP